MAKKIAILTQPLINNYGGILQNYALQYVLKEMGYNPITLDRHFGSYPFYKLFLNYYKRKIKSFFDHKKVLSSEDIVLINRNVSRFIKENINITPKLCTDKELIKAFEDNNCDTIIVGSDQVWRPMYSPNIYNYFLDFLSGNNSIAKIAYSASFGTDNWEFTPEQTKICSLLIQNFDAISIREKSGITLCKNHLNRSTIHTLDPTLLLSKEKYISLFNGKNYNSNKGVYTYILDSNPSKRQIIDRVKEIFNKDEYNNQPKDVVVNPISKSINDYIFPDVESWIKGFHDADFVVTDSFHGTVFSIIFNKPFLVIGNKMRGLSRFSSLLIKLGLEERLILNSNELDVSLIHKLINYNKVNRKIEKERLFSINWLYEELNN